MDKELVALLLKAGCQMTPEAIELLENYDNPKRIVKTLLTMDKKPPIINRNIINSIIKFNSAKEKEVSPSESQPKLEVEVVKKAKLTKPKEGRKRISDLNGKTWTRYSISIWDMTKSSNEMKLKHPAMFPEELVQRLIRIYTRKGDVVLDPFLGSGTTVIVARNLERKSIGFEIAKKFIKLAKKRLSQQMIVSEKVEEPTIYEEDARKLLEHVKPNSVDLVITSPPYWDIHRQKRTADYKKIRPYSESDIDIGNIPDYSEFIDVLKDVFQKVYAVLKPQKWCVIILMDLRKKDRFYPFHIDVSKMMQDNGFKFEDIIIWDRRRDYSNLRPLGYPYVFRVNKIHEYIMIFKKEEK